MNLCASLECPAKKEAPLAGLGKRFTLSAKMIYFDFVKRLFDSHFESVRLRSRGVYMPQVAGKNRKPISATA